MAYGQSMRYNSSNPDMATVAPAGEITRSLSALPHSEGDIESHSIGVMDVEFHTRAPASRTRSSEERLQADLTKPPL